MSTPDPIEFAQRWIAAWNARDLETVLADHADDVVFTSPTAMRVVPGSGGTIRGKDQLRQYWSRALERSPDLHHELVAVYQGLETLAVHFRDEAGAEVIDVLTFDRGLVKEGHATHLIAAR